MRVYEDLRGQNGKRLYYRAERFRAQDLFKPVSPELTLNHTPYSLHDISMNGLGAYTTRGSGNSPGVGERLSVRIGVKGVTLHEGTGEISRIEITPFGRKVGVRLADRCVDVRELVSSYDKVILRSKLEENSTDIQSALAPAYRQLCADILYLLRHYRVALDRFATTHPSEAAKLEMLEFSEERIWPHWSRLWHRGNEILRPLASEPAVVEAAKRLTETVITPELITGPFWRRAYEKPLGYPGDFAVMNYVYDWRYEGDTLFDRLAHRLGTRTAECVTARMLLVRDAIADVMDHDSAAPATIASLGCGSAREISGYLQRRDLPRNVSFTLIDQDHGALSYAYEHAYPEVLRLAGQATVTCLQASFMQLMRAGELFQRIAPQNFIYSVGLLDYLPTKRAKAFISAMYDHLAPGGTLFIGNMLDADRGTYWATEFVCDWSLIYRTEREMCELVDGLPASEVSTEVDRTGCVVMLRLRKH